MIKGGSKVRENRFNVNKFGYGKFIVIYMLNGEKLGGKCYWGVKWGNLLFLFFFNVVFKLLVGVIR